MKHLNLVYSEYTLEDTKICSIQCYVFFFLFSSFFFTNITLVLTSAFLKRKSKSVFGKKMDNNHRHVYHTINICMYAFVSIYETSLSVSPLYFAFCFCFFFLLLIWFINWIYRVLLIQIWNLHSWCRWRDVWLNH
jgi:hypothetical protein